MTELLKMHEIYIHYIYLSKQSFNELFFRHTVLQFPSISYESSALKTDKYYITHSSKSAKYTALKVGQHHLI